MEDWNEKNLLSPMDWKRICSYVYNAVIIDKLFTLKDLQKMFPRLCTDIRFEGENSNG